MTEETIQNPIERLRETMRSGGFESTTVEDRGTAIGVLAWNPTKPLKTSNVELRDRALFVASPEHQCVFVIGCLGEVQEAEHGLGKVFIAPWSVIPQALIWSAKYKAVINPIPLWEYEKIPTSSVVTGLYQWLAWRKAMHLMIEDRINTKWTTDQLGPHLGAALSQVLR